MKAVTEEKKTSEKLPFVNVINVNAVIPGGNTTIEGDYFGNLDEGEEVILIFDKFEKKKIGVKFKVEKSEVLRYGKLSIFGYADCRVKYDMPANGQVKFEKIVPQDEHYEVIAKSKKEAVDCFLKAVEDGIYAVESEEILRKVDYSDADTAADLMFFYTHRTPSDVEEFFPMGVFHRLMKIRDLIKRDRENIKKELYKKGSDCEIYCYLIEEADLPSEVYEKAQKELEKLKRVAKDPQESAKIIEWLDVLLGLPWHKRSEGEIDIAKAEQIMAETHYGMPKVKERIVQKLAVEKLNPENRSTILCLYGPPGTGKTSIGKSVAKAMGRKFISMALGGVRDEAEIRGHRTTYVGAKPGRFIDELLKCGESNPVIFLDELDKLGQDGGGSGPASALLEVLDAKQNDRFKDHYLEVPFNLSEIFFVATVNSLATIPRPLLDRMEVVSLSAYSEDEKLEIARNYLVPSEVWDKLAGKVTVEFPDETLEAIIDNYTREAGVRALENAIGRICSCLAVEFNKTGKNSFVIKKEDLPGYLEDPMIRVDQTEESIPGMVNGMYASLVGLGGTLPVQARAVKGKGSFKITGNVAKVTSESFEVAVSLIRAISEELGIEDEYFEKHDIHAHFTDAATPKDGPSGGITLVAALVSMATKKSVDHKLAFTGEIDLMGRVLPVGGVDQKILGSMKAGITRFIVPDCEGSRREIAKIPEKKLEGIEIHYEKRIERVLEIAGLMNDK